MSPAMYTRYELLRALRNRRYFIFSLGFPLVLFFIIAAPNRGVHDFDHTGVSLPLYYMVSLASFGTIFAMISSGGGSPPSARPGGRASCASRRCPCARTSAPRCSPPTPPPSPASRCCTSPAPRSA
ncbi:MAG TPA: hypothetical protein VK778_11800 [Solirubrobacteraceae bacterium]|nr:hypothetical protein [Solirubrobacteraceae bacterium]